MSDFIAGTKHVIKCENLNLQNLPLAKKMLDTNMLVTFAIHNFLKQAFRHFLMEIYGRSV